MQDTHLDELRDEIDGIDARILELFNQRAELADRIGTYKHEQGLPVYDRSRERQKVIDAGNATTEDLKTHAQVLMELLMEASRRRQTEVAGASNPTLDAIEDALAHQPATFPSEAYVACQGVEGAYAQIAAERIFHHPAISFFDSWEGVFKAVEQGFVDYGVLPIENSYAGSVNKVFDLMMRHDFHIVRSTRIKVDHYLLAKPGTRLGDVRVIYSHQQAISQCQDYIASLPDVRVHVCDNTAVAAKAVADSDRDDVAALASPSCAQLYGLSVLARDVQDSGSNFTRFATIARDLVIYPGANRTSLQVVTSNEPGSLYKVLGKFYALDINILKLESRPIPDRDFDFSFFFDVDCEVASPKFRALMATLPNLCSEFRYLGSYSEVV